MHPSLRNRIRKEQNGLLLGASDMRQTLAAIRACRLEPDEDLLRALMTAIAVCFMRAWDRLPRAYHLPAEDPDAQLFEDMNVLRDRVYAHSDPRALRRIHSVTSQMLDGETLQMISHEWWVPLTSNQLDQLEAFCEHAKRCMELDAAKAQEILDGQMPAKGNWDIG